MQPGSAAYRSAPKAVPSDGKATGEKAKTTLGDAKDDKPKPIKLAKERLSQKYTRKAPTYKSPRDGQPALQKPPKVSS